MRGLPDHRNNQPTLPSPTIAPPTLVLQESIPERMAELGREVLDMVPRKERDSLEAYRRAANSLSPILRVKRVRVKRRDL